jgi:hypothetical protein
MPQNTNTQNTSVQNSSQLYDQLKSGLDELKKTSFPGKEIRWHDDGWKNLRDAKLDQRWEELRKACATQKNNEINNKFISSEDKNFSSILNSIFNREKISDVKVNDSEMKVLANNLNPIFNQYRDKMLGEKNSNLFDIIKNKSSSSFRTSSSSTDISTNKKIFEIIDGKMIIDIEETNFLIQKTIKSLIENKDRISVSVENISIGIGAGLLYKTVVAAYKNSLDSLTTEDKLKGWSEEQKKSYLESLTKNKSMFNNSGAVIITVILYVLANMVKTNNTFGFKVETSQSEEGFNKKLLFPILFKNKLPKWFKIIIIIIIFLIISYIVIYKNYTTLGTIFILKLFTILWPSLLILYYLLSLSILINNLNKNNNDKNIKIPKYYPPQIKNHIKKLMLIDNISVSIAYMRLYVISAIYMFFILMIVVFTNIFWIDLIK